MFSNNNQISMRQAFRLFTYDLMGISTLILPTVLAKKAGCDGIFCILAGTGLTLLYVWYLGAGLKQMGTDLQSFCKNNLSVFWNKVIFFWLFVQSVLLAGFSAYIFSDLMKKSLLKEESFWLILVIILIMGMYGIWSGIEGRARVYEVLFWFILIPLFLMLAGAVKGVDTDYWTPIFESSPMGFLEGSYLVFLLFSSVAWMIFFPQYTPKKKGKLLRAVRLAVILAGEILAVLYLILLGTFGSGALSEMEYPAVTFMSTVQILGGFMKRADALMLGVWFFTLFALLNSNLYYGASSLMTLCNGKNQKCFSFWVTLFSFFSAASFYLWQGWINTFYYYFAYIGMPLLILVPGVIALFAKRKHKSYKILSCILLMIGLSVMTGCGNNELEDRCFPMMAVIDEEKENGQVRVSYLYQPLDEVSDQTAGDKGTDTFSLTSGNFYKSWHDYEVSLNKKVDYHHLKVMILGADFLNHQEQLEEMLSVLEHEDEFPRNTYICITDQMDKLFGIEDQLPENIGTYLEELLENNEYVDANGLPTLGKLYEESKNKQETLFFPFIKVEGEHPVLDGYYCMKRGTVIGKIPMNCGYIGFIEGNHLKKFDLQMADGSVLELDAFHANYDFSVFGRITINVKCEGKMKYGTPLSSKNASLYVSNFFTELASQQKVENDIDLSNSYKKLAGHNREWFEAWMEQKNSGTENAKMSFEENTNFVYNVKVAMTTEHVVGGFE